MSDQTTNRTNCCVYGCSSRADQDKDISFHLIPKQGSRTVKIVNKLGIEEFVDIRKAWDKMLKSGKKLTNVMKVSSKHFLKNDYILPDVPCKKKTLKKNAIPSKNLPLQLPVNAYVQNRIQRKRDRYILEETPSTSNSFCQSNEENIIIEANEENPKIVEEIISGLSQPTSHLQTCKCDKS
ncbi:THAP domain-containing protein 1, partial [Aphis craccivora]